MGSLEAELLEIIESSHGTFDCATLAHALLVRTNYRGSHFEILSITTNCCEKFCDMGIIKRSNSNACVFKRC